MTFNGNHDRKRKLGVPSPLNLENLSESLVSCDEYICSSPKGPKSPKVCIPNVANRRHFPQCTICIDDLLILDEEPVKGGGVKPGSGCQRPIVMTKCGHVFHTECINKWFMENKDKEYKNCPMCRKEMRSNDTRRLFLVLGNKYTTMELPNQNRRNCPQCIICIDDLIIFDDEPANKENGIKPKGCCQRPTVVTNCGHAFHTGCINKWFLEHKEKEFKNCPMCRKDMRSNDTRRLFLVCGEE